MVSTKDRDKRVCSSVWDKDKLLDDHYGMMPIVIPKRVGGSKWLTGGSYFNENKSPIIMMEICPDHHVTLIKCNILRMRILVLFLTVCDKAQRSYCTRNAKSRFDDFKHRSIDVLITSLKRDSKNRNKKHFRLMFGQRIQKRSLWDRS